MTQSLSTTSFAILGLIGEGGGSAYDLAKAMSVNLAYIWPSARSHVFAEVKRLERLGLIASAEDRGHPRRRRLLRITEAGQAALSGWLATRPEAFALQVEGLLRVFLAGLGGRDDLVAALRATEAEAEAMLALAGRIIPAYLAGGGPYPQRVHLRAIMIDFLTRFAAMTQDWAQRHAATVEGWDDLSLAPHRDWAMALLAGMPRLRQD